MKKNEIFLIILIALGVAGVIGSIIFIKAYEVYKLPWLETAAIISMICLFFPVLILEFSFASGLESPSFLEISDFYCKVWYLIFFALIFPFIAIWIATLGNYLFGFVPNWQADGPNFKEYPHDLWLLGAAIYFIPIAAGIIYRVMRRRKTVVTAVS